MVCESELFVERAIQDAKGSCKYRARAFPEPIIGKYYLLQQQELAMRVEWAGKFPALFEPAREQLPHGASSQCLDGPADASSHMLGVGKRPDSTQTRVLKEALQQACRYQPPTPDSFLHAWHAAGTGLTIEFEVYERAALRGSEIVHAEAYLRSARASHFCLVFYEEESQPGGLLMERPYAAQIKWFVKVTLTSQQLNTPPRTERFAIADTLPLQQKLCCGASYFAHELKASCIPTAQLVPKPNARNYPIPLEELKRKLVWCPYNNVTVRNVPQPKHWLFTQYCHNKSYVDAESAAEF